MVFEFKTKVFNSKLDNKLLPFSFNSAMNGSNKAKLQFSLDIFLSFIYKRRGFIDYRDKIKLFN